VGLSLKRLGSQIWDQINPLDNGRSWETRTPTTSNSVASQAGTIGKAFVAKPVGIYSATKAARAGVAGLGRIGYESVFGTDDSYQRAIDTTSRAMDYQLQHGTFGVGSGTNISDWENVGARQLAGNAINSGVQTAQWFVPTLRIPVGGLAGTAAGKVLQNPVTQRAINNAAQSLVGSGVSQYVESGKISPGQLAKDTLVGVVSGEALPAVAGIAGKAKVGFKGSPEISAPSKRTIRMTNDEAALLSDYLDYREGRWKAKGSDLNKLIPIAERVAKNNDINLRNVAEVREALSTHFDQTTAPVGKPARPAGSEVDLGKANELDRLMKINRKLSRNIDQEVKLSKMKEGELPSSDPKVLVATAANKLAVSDKLLAPFKDKTGGGFLGDKPTIKNLLGEEVPNPAYKAKAKQPKAAKQPKSEAPKTTEAQLEQAIMGGNRSTKYKTSTVGKLAETLSPNRQLRKVTSKLEAAEDAITRGSLESGSRIGRAPGRLAVGVSRQAGRTNAEIAALGRFQGGKKLGDVYAKGIADQGITAMENGVRHNAVAAALDPELHLAKGGKAPKLSALEKAEVARLRGIIDLTHRGEYELGLIDKATYKANKGKYFPRDFTKFFLDDSTRKIAKDNKLDLNIFKQRKDLADIPKEVIAKAETDPYYMTALRVQQYMKNKAIIDYSNGLAKSDAVSSAPKVGYIQVPDSPSYGALKGKYVLKERLEDLQGFIYETSTAQHLVALLNTYDRNPIRQGLKASKTIYNPGVRIGNRTFNYLTASLNGINPITFSKNWYRGKGMMKSSSPEYLEAVRNGVFGSSMIDKELYRAANPLSKTKNPLKKVHQVTADTYAGVDDSAKMATYLTYRERGLSPEEAAHRTQRFQQNYDMVGHFFDLGAKAPIGGNAFVRFSSELMRIAHNTAVDNPLRLAGAMAAVVALTNFGSHISGESADDRKTREGRLGAPRVPFTNQSLEIQTPFGAINVGRLLGITTYNDVYGGVQEDIKRLLPFQSPVNYSKDKGFSFNPQFVTSDPLIGPLIGQVIDKDFRGKSIKDPEGDKYPSQPLSSAEQFKNRVKTAAMSYIPLSNEADSVVSAAQGKENFYGKQRSVPQALLRVGGIKVEQYGPEQAKAQRGKDQYFEGEFKRAEQFLRDNPDLVTSYNKFKSREKDRTTGRAYFDLVTPEKWSLVSADRSNRLYDFLKQEALIAYDREGKPIDPIFQLPTPEQQRMVLELRSRATGDDIEAEEILRATQPWYAAFEKAERDYYAASEKHFKNKNLPNTEGDRAKAYRSIPYPEQPELIKRYYQLRESNPDAARALFTTTDLSSQFDAYKQERLKYINAKRKIEGFPPISAEAFNNVTFGYEGDERKVYNELRYGRGYGGFSGRKNGSSNKYAYAVSSSGRGGGFKAPSVVKVATAPTTLKTARIARPKVSIKRSKV